MQIKLCSILGVSLIFYYAAAQSDDLIDRNEKIQPNGVVTKAESYNRGEVIY